MKTHCRKAHSAYDELIAGMTRKGVLVSTQETTGGNLAVLVPLWGDKIQRVVFNSAGEQLLQETLEAHTTDEPPEAAEFLSPCCRTSARAVHVDGRQFYECSCGALWKAGKK